MWRWLGRRRRRSRWLTSLARPSMRDSFASNEMSLSMESSAAAAAGCISRLARSRAPPLHLWLDYYAHTEYLAGLPLERPTGAHVAMLNYRSAQIASWRTTCATTLTYRPCDDTFLPLLFQQTHFYNSQATLSLCAMFVLDSRVCDSKKHNGARSLQDDNSFTHAAAAVAATDDSRGPANSLHIFFRQIVPLQNFYGALSLVARAILVMTKVSAQT